MTATTRDQWRTLAAYLRQLADQAERDGKTGKANRLRLDADDAERKAAAEQGETVAASVGS